MRIHIGANIKTIRELKNLTQQYVAEAIGISQSMYSRIEQDKEELTFSRLESIAQALEVNPLHLINFNGTQYINSISHSQVGNGQYIDQRRISADEFDHFKQLIFHLQSEVQLLRQIVESKR